MSDETTGDSPERLEPSTGGHQLARWFLLSGNRLHVTVLVAASVFVTFLGVADLFSPAFSKQVAAGDMLDTIFSTMITVIVTGATLVVTIGQLVLSQENGPLGDQRDRMSNSMDVREFTAELTGSPTPTEPAAFLGEILAATETRAVNLRATIDGTRNGSGNGQQDSHGDIETGDLERTIDQFGAEVAENAAVVREHLDGADFESFDVLLAALGFDYSREIFRVESITAEFGNTLSHTQQDLLDELKTALTLYGPAREHVKTLYFQWALIDLSRLILYTAVPAVVVAALMIAVVDAGTFPGRTLGFDTVLLVVAAALAVTLLPFVLFVSYILRILTVAKRTLAIEPLILQGSDR